MRARTDGEWRPGAPLLFDVLAGAILVAFFIAGWRHLRATAAAPPEPYVGPQSGDALRTESRP